MKELRYVSPSGMIGSGYFQSSFEAALDRDPHFIGCDGGSTDDGPYQLGSGTGTMFGREACKRDLRPILRAVSERKVPFLTGSAGGAGTDAHVNWELEIIEELAREAGQSYRVALIYAEPSREYLKRRRAEGRLLPLTSGIEVSDKLIDGSTHIVGMMGVEPFIQALGEGAEVVLGGRSSDTSIFAAIPVKQGYPHALAWHAAKVLECGAAAVTQRLAPDSMFCTMTEDSFVVEPLNPELRSTPQSIAAHTLYENSDPYLLTEPSGVLDTSSSSYEALNERAVRVTGSRFHPADRYTVKLEGAELVGYQTLVLGAIRDPVIIGQLSSWLETMELRVRERIDGIFGTDMSSQYSFTKHVYGVNGVMGPREPVTEIRSHEVFLAMEFTAGTQDLADTLAASAGHIALHHPVPEWSGLISALAFPYAPHTLPRGPVYRFNLNHVVVVDDPCEMFRIEMVEVKG